MSIYIYIFTMALTTYLIRMLPLTIFRKPIRSRFLRSFLHYVPYACLTAMTFPAILYDTASVLSGGAALVIAVILSFRGKSLLTVSLASCAAVYITEQILPYFLCPLGVVWITSVAFFASFHKASKVEPPFTTSMPLPHQVLFAQYPS